MRVETAVAAENHDLGSGFGREREFQGVIGLEGDAGKSVTWPRNARIQPFSDTTTVTGSRTTIASSIAASSCAGAMPKVVRRLPISVFGPNFSRISLI